MSDSGSQELARARWSIRTKVRVALLGVLVLIIPQVTLTIYYAVQLSDSTSRVAALTHFVVASDKIGRRITDIGLPQALAEDARTRAFEVELAKLLEASRLLPDGGPGMTQETRRIVAGLEALKAASGVWIRTLQRTRESAPKDAFEEIATRSQAEGGAGVPSMREAASAQLLDVQASLNTAISRAYIELDLEERHVDGVIAHADRNLISLTMLTVMFLLVLFAALPGQLVRPMGHLANVIRQAGTGKLEGDEHVGLATQDEVGEIAVAFRDTMRRLRAFDDRKRDRIMEDASKLEVLLGALGGAAAVVDSRFVIDYANAPFRQLLGITRADTETPIPELMREGGDKLRHLLTRALEQRESLTAHQVIVTDREGAETAFECRVDLCRDRHGLTTHLLVMFRPSEA